MSVILLIKKFNSSKCKLVPALKHKKSKKNPLSFSRLHGVPQRRFAGRRRFYRGMADCINKYSAMRGRIGFTECKVLPVFHLHFIILSASPQYARTCIRQPSHLPTDVL
jgi:hypothetical protein